MLSYHLPFVAHLLSGNTLLLYLLNSVPVDYQNSTDSSSTNSRVFGFLIGELHTSRQDLTFQQLERVHS